MIRSTKVEPNTMEEEEAVGKKVAPSTARRDVIAWLFGMLFIVFIIGMSWVWGEADGWYALSGYTYVNTTKDGVVRFTPEPYGCNDTSTPGRSGTDCTANWYFWKLPYDHVSTLSRAMVWLFYATHQIFVWALIYKAQLENSPENRKKGTSKYSGNIRWYNVALLLVNALFHVLHLVQTHWTYDGLAQDTAINSSQASVVLLISLIMLLEYRDRGCFFMWPNPRHDGKWSKRLRLNQKPINLVRKYHGYYFAWSIIYTFWYHPFENTWAHTMGFFHTGMVMLQGSLIFTEMHLNKYWRLINEIWVLFHATVVAIQTADPSKSDQLWPMFFFGFGFMACFTQVFILPFWSKISAYFRVIPPLLYLVVTFVVYGVALPGGIGKVYEIFFISSLQYLNMFLAWLVLYFFMWIEAKAGGSKKSPSSTWSVVWLCTLLLLYSLMVLFSHLARNLPIPFLILMEIFAVLFLVLACTSYIVHKQLLGPFTTRRVPETAVEVVSGEGNRSFDEGNVTSSTSEKL